MFQDIPKLAELPFVRYAFQSKVSMSTTTSRLFQYSKCDPMLMPKILLLIRIIFKKKKEDSSCLPLSYFPCFGHNLLHFAMFLLTQYASKTRILSSTTYSPRFGAKNEIYYSLLLFICHYSLLLFTCYYSLRIFAYLRGAVPYFKQVFSVLSSGLLP